MPDQLEKFDGGERSGFGGFEDATVSGGQTGGEFPGRHEQRVIPGNDLATNADGLAHDHRGDIRVGHLKGLALGFGDQTGIVAEAIGRIGHIILRLAQRFAVVACLQHSELFGAPFDGVCQPEEVAGALAGAYSWPGAIIECFAGRGDGDFGVADRSVRHGGDGLVVRRVEDFTRAAFEGGFPFAVDKEVGGAHNMRRTGKSALECCVCVCEIPIFISETQH